MTFELVAEVLVTSPEYTASHSSNSLFVTGLYNQVLGRTPSPAELNFWVNQLNQSLLTRLQVATFFLTGSEYQTDLLNGGTWTPYNPLTNWGGYYPEFLRRLADSGGLKYWSAGPDGRRHERPGGPRGHLGLARRLRQLVVGRTR